MNEEQILWQNALQGDGRAFQTLATRYFADLYAYGSKFSTDRDFVKDCIQDTLLYIWEHRENLSRQVHVKSYLLSSLRRRLHRTKNNERFDKTLLEESRLFDIEFSVESRFIEMESWALMSQLIKEKLDVLPKRQKEVIYLRFFQNLDRDDIAAVMDIAPQTVSNLLQMAFKHLRSGMGLQARDFFQ